MIFRHGHSLKESEMEGYKDDSTFLYINSCGYQKYNLNDGFKHRLNGRLDYLLVYIINGKCMFKSGEYKVIDKGTIALYRPGEEQLYRFFGSQQTEDYWVHFTGSNVEDLLAILGFENNSFIKIGLYQEYFDIFEAIIQELQLKKPSYETLSAAKFIEFISLAGRKINEKSLNVINSKYPIINIVMQRMHNEYNEDLSVHALAKAYNIDEDYFIKLFKRVSGMSPLKYLTNIRIQKAKHLLANTSATIIEVSDLVGYKSYNYFSRIFKQYTGIPPSEYKNSFYK